MSKEKIFTIYSDDQKKFNFRFYLEKGGKIAIEAKQESAGLPIIYRKSFAKEEFVNSKKIILQDPQIILEEIASSFQSNTARFTLKKTEMIFCFFMFKGSVEIKLSIPLISNFVSEAINIILSKIDRLTTLSTQYKRHIKKITNNFSKNKALIKFKKQNQDSNSSALINLMNEHNSQIAEKLNFIEKIIIENERERKLDLNSQKNDQKSSPFIPSKLQIIKDIETKSGINSLCFLKDGRLISGDVNGNMEIYRLKTYEPYITIRNSNFIGVLRNGNIATSDFANIFGNASSDFDANIKIYEIGENDYKLIHTLKGHTNAVNKLIELEDGKLVSCSNDKTIKIWDDTNNYESVQTLLDNTESVISVIEMNNYFVSVSSKSSLNIWEKLTYECKGKIEGNDSLTSNNV